MPGDDDEYPPHFSLAYVNSATDPTTIRAALGAVSVPPVTASVRRVTLIETHRDAQMYEWRPIEHVLLGEQ